MNILNNVEVEQHQDEKPNKKPSLIETKKNSEYILSGIADLFKQYESSKLLPRRSCDYELIENPQTSLIEGARSEEDLSGDELQDVVLPRQLDAGPSKPPGNARIRALCEGYNAGQLRLSAFLRNVRGSIRPRK